jgi:hypothetical protein
MSKIYMSDITKTEVEPGADPHDVYYYEVLMELKLQSMSNREERIKGAVENFGSEIVDFVLSVVHLSDPDGAWSLFESQGMFSHSQCVEEIYFE